MAFASCLAILALFSYELGVRTDCTPRSHGVSQLTPRQFNHRKSSVVLQNPSEACTARSTAFFEPKNANKPGKVAWLAKFLAPRVGFEPTTLRLTAGCSAVELPRNACAFPSAQGSIIANCTTGASGLFLKMLAFLISSIIAGVLPLADPQPTRISAGLDIPHARQQGGRALRALV